MRLPHISHIAAFFAYFSKQSICISHILPHKLAFSTAILILFVFVLPISIRFRYLDHLVANRMAPSTCPDLWGTRRGSWFLAILCHISAYFCRIFGVCAVRIDLTSERSDGQYRLCACDACCSDALLSCQHTGRTFYTVLQHVLSTSRSAPRSRPSECGSRSRALSVKVAIVPV